MAKLKEEGLINNPRWHDGPLAGILLGNRNEMNGAKLENPIMIINVATNPSADEYFGIGTKTYTFKGSGATGDQINLGATAALTAAAIISKINTDNMSNTNRANSPQCSAYTLGKSTLILLVDNLVEDNAAAPAFSDTGCIGKLVEDMCWMNEITQHMLLDFDYFRVSIETDVDTKPITLVERNAGTYQNFLY